MTYEHPHPLPRVQPVRDESRGMDSLQRTAMDSPDAGENGNREKGSVGHHSGEREGGIGAGEKGGMTMKPKCRDRILAALKWAAKSPQQLADELFVTKVTAQIHLAALSHDGLVFRKFFHNGRKNTPDYIYSSVRFPAYAQPIASRKSTLAQDVLGSWDSL